jgi:hypothetical protein
MTELEKLILALSKSESVDKCMNSIFRIQKVLFGLNDQYKWRGLGNLLGDYGEFKAMEIYELEKAEGQTADFDAFYNDGSLLSVQIKTMNFDKNINLRETRCKSDRGAYKKGDIISPNLLLVNECDPATLQFTEIYNGIFPTKELLSELKLRSNLSDRDNKYRISKSTLIKLQGFCKPVIRRKPASMAA